MQQDAKEINWNQYYNNVLSDFREMKDHYPFSLLTILPTVKPEPAIIHVIAVNKEMIEAVGCDEEDFLGDYSRELHIIIPFDYRKEGCKVYGAKWIDPSRFQNKDIHFYHDDVNQNMTKYGFQFCVGTPDSFQYMKNTILENVRTAENMLIAYERVMIGLSDKLDLIAYSHGDKGREEFLKNRTRYIPKR